MSKLISGKEALIALANGEEVEIKTDVLSPWKKLKQKKIRGLDFYLKDRPNHSDSLRFRLKPRTITINGVELAPCYAVGIDHIKNEVSIQFHNNEDAVKLNSLLLNIYMD